MPPPPKTGTFGSREPGLRAETHNWPPYVVLTAQVPLATPRAELDALEEALIGVAAAAGAEYGIINEEERVGIGLLRVWVEGSAGGTA